MLSAKGYHVLYTNPRGSRGYGERFCGEIAGGWGNLDYQDLMAALDLVISGRTWTPSGWAAVGPTAAT